MTHPTNLLRIRTPLVLFGTQKYMKTHSSACKESFSLAFHNLYFYGSSKEAWKVIKKQNNKKEHEENRKCKARLSALGVAGMTISYQFLY